MDIYNIQHVLHNPIATDMQHLGRNKTKYSMKYIAKWYIYETVVDVVEAQHMQGFLLLFVQCIFI